MNILIKKFFLSINLFLYSPIFAELQRANFIYRRKEREIIFFLTRNSLLKIRNVGVRHRIFMADVSFSPTISYVGELQCISRNKDTRTSVVAANSCRLRRLGILRGSFSLFDSRYKNNEGTNLQGRISYFCCYLLYSLMCYHIFVLSNSKNYLIVSRILDITTIYHYFLYSLVIVCNMYIIYNYKF